jgi:hypothetical protein
MKPPYHCWCCSTLHTQTLNGRTQTTESGLRSTDVCTLRGSQMLLGFPGKADTLEWGLNEFSERGSTVPGPTPHYPPEFKRKAVELYRSSEKSIPMVA